MRTITSLCASLLFASALDIPTGDARVYADLTVNNQGRVSLPFRFADTTLDLYLSMSQPRTFLVDKTCQKCDTTHQYEFKEGSTANEEVAATSGSFLKFDQAVNKMTKYQVSGAVYSDNVMLNKGNKTYPLKTQFFSVQESKPDFKSEFTDGILGLAPVAQLAATPEQTFLQNLKDAGLIDKTIMSMHITRDQKGEQAGTVIFGGWDEKGKDDEEEDLSVVETVSPLSWDVLMNTTFRFNDKQIQLYDSSLYNQTALFDASYPFIYIPPDDWDVFSKDLSKQIREAASVAMPWISFADPCGPDKRFSRRYRCIFPLTCEQWLDANIKLDLVLQLNDTKGNTIQLKFNASQLLQNPEDVATVSGSATDTDCFLPFFSDSTSALANDKRWILGTYVLREYYTIFDATPFDNFLKTGENKGPNRIGVATSSHKNDIVPQPPARKGLAMMTVIIGLVLTLLIVGALGYCLCCRRRSSAELNAILSQQESLADHKKSYNKLHEFENDDQNQSQDGMGRKVNINTDNSQSSMEQPQNTALGASIDHW